ncbi:hypothetical protein [Desulfobacter sp.]|uniref:hypothetical protein n=1 Tax=Desulfobacter sp. TaxID=2294 RepID=UPI003D123735
MQSRYPSKVPCMTKDRFLSADIAAVRTLLQSSRLVRAVEDAVDKRYQVFERLSIRPVFASTLA